MQVLKHSLNASTPFIGCPGFHVFLILKFCIFGIQLETHAIMHDCALAAFGDGENVNTHHLLFACQYCHQTY
jgi:hypothetical protein